MWHQGGARARNSPSAMTSASGLPEHQASLGQRGEADLAERVPAWNGVRTWSAPLSVPVGDPARQLAS